MIFNLAILIILLFLFVRYIIYRIIEKRSIALNPELVTKTILAQKAGIHRLTIPFGKHILYSHWLEIDPTGPSVFIVHGNGESLSDWVDTQKLLKELGYNSYVFDFAGFGSSGGKANVKSLEKSTELAWDHFCKLTTASSARLIVAHSLGVAILLGVLSNLKPKPAKIILHGAFSSAREITIFMNKVPSYLSWFIPNVWNNLNNIKNVSAIETHLYHSKSDLKIPYTMSENIAAQNSEVNLHILDNYGHNVIYENIEKKFWEVILI